MRDSKIKKNRPPSQEGGPQGPLPFPNALSTRQFIGAPTLVPSNLRHLPGGLTARAFAGLLRGLSAFHRIYIQIFLKFSIVQDQLVCWLRRSLIETRWSQVRFPSSVLFFFFFVFFSPFFSPLLPVLWIFFCR